MGTSLTGLTPATTYDALIKVTDNGSLSGTAKYLSDGLGNDSKLALGTSGVGIGTTNPVTIFTAEDTNANIAVVNVVGTSPNYIFDVRDDGTSVFRVAGSGNVGIGTSAPTRQLSISATNPQMVLKSTTTTGFSELYFGDSSADNGYVGYAHNGDYMYFGTNNSEKLRILSGGGITFNGDATQANALDDYEEGTFTATFTTTGTDFTASTNTTSGKYTKIGNLVTIQLNAVLGGAVSGGTGDVKVTGLPFTSSTQAFGVFSSGRVTLSGNNYFSAINSGTTEVVFGYLNSGALSTTLPASDINGNTTPFISTTITYQV